MDYKLKYLKYKKKYINLKNEQMGGNLKMKDLLKVQETLIKLLECKEDKLSDIVSECNINMLSLLKMRAFFRSLNKNTPENKKNKENKEKNEMLIEEIDKFIDIITNRKSVDDSEQSGGFSLKALLIHGLQITTALVSYNAAVTATPLHQMGIPQVPTASIDLPSMSTALSITAPSTTSISTLPQVTDSWMNTNSNSLVKMTPDVIEQVYELSSTGNEEQLCINGKCYTSAKDDNIEYVTHKKDKESKIDDFTDIMEESVAIKDADKEYDSPSDYCKGDNAVCGQTLGIPRKFMPQVPDEFPELINEIAEEGDILPNDVYNDNVELQDLDELLATQKEGWRAKITDDEPQAIFDKVKHKEKHQKFAGMVSGLEKLAEGTNGDSEKFHKKVEKFFNKDPIIIMETEEPIEGKNKFVLDGHHRFFSFKHWNKIAEKSFGKDYKLKGIPAKTIKLPKGQTPYDVIQKSLDIGYPNKQLSGEQSFVKSVATFSNI
jgi:hypothetical protein